MDHSNINDLFFAIFWAISSFFEVTRINTIIQFVEYKSLCAAMGQINQT